MTAMPVAVIAGAGAGGSATAVSLARSGYRIVLLDSRPESADAAAEAVRAAGGEAEAVGVDLLDPEAVAALRSELLARHGRVDVLVHLVGGWRGTSTLEPASVDAWDALHPPIVGTLAVLTTQFAEDVRSSPVGRVLMVTSTAAARPTAGNIAYAAAKSAAEAWTAGVAHYLRDTQAAAVVIAVKALLTDAMIEADPAKEWPGYTHVTALGDAIAAICTHPVENGARVDLTAAP